MESSSHIGVVGAGNMGSALVEGITKSKELEQTITVYDQDAGLKKEVGEQYRVKTADSLQNLVESSECILLCVKPGDVPEVLNEFTKPDLQLISIAAGVEIETLKEHSPVDINVIRVMPNTPAQVGEGMSFLSRGSGVSDSFLNAARNIFGTVGETIVVPEKKMNAVTALSGSGPAYVFYLISALRDAGIHMGLDHNESLMAAIQTFYGSAKLAKESDLDPEDLLRSVSSPGGTTVEALQVLEEESVSGDFKQAVLKACKKSEQMD